MTATIRTASGWRERLANSRWRCLLRLVRQLWEVTARMVVLLFVVNTVHGLFATAQVQALRRLVDVAQQVVAGQAPLLVGLGWGGALGLLAFGRTAVMLGERVLADRFQEVVRGVIEERAYAHAQQLPLEAFEQPERHDQLQRVRSGMERRFFSTMAFFWRSVSNVATLLSLLIYLRRHGEIT